MAFAKPKSTVEPRSSRSMRFATVVQACSTSFTTRCPGRARPDRIVGYQFTCPRNNMRDWLCLERISSAIRRKPAVSLAMYSTLSAIIQKSSLRSSLSEDAISDGSTKDNADAAGRALDHSKADLGNPVMCMVSIDSRGTDICRRIRHRRGAGQRRVHGPEL